MSRFIALIAILCSISVCTIAQTSKQAGYIYNWANYSSDCISGLGSRPVVWDSTGMADIVHAPDVGIHPRVYFGPSEIPDIVNRLNNTSSGAAAKNVIHAYNVLLHLGSAYNQNAPYARDADGNRYIDNSGAWNTEPFYTALKAHDPTVWDGATVKNKSRTAALMAMEAFICLLYPTDFDSDIGLSNNTRAMELADAMDFWAQLVIGDPNVNPSGTNYLNFGGAQMALCYDLLYNYLSASQAQNIRTALSQIIPDEPRHGGYTSCYANTSNWSTLNTFEIVTNLAIEGEAGYKPNLTERWMRALHTFINYGWYPSGAGYEGLGKNYQFVTTLIVCAKRGYSLLAHPHVRAYGEDFLPAIMQPFGEGFTSYDVWGGSGYDEEKGQYKFNAADAVGLKWAFPNSNEIDFVWRNYINTFYQNDSEGYVYAQVVPDDSYNNYLIPAAIFAMDYSSQPWQDQADAVIEEDYFADDRGLAVFKTGSDQQALSLQFHARQDMGGHTHGDRLDFTLSALGRVWVRKSYGGSQFQPSKFHSMVLVDGLGVGVGDPDGDKCRQPAKVVSIDQGPLLSKMMADATYAYTWEWHWSPQDPGNDHPWLGNNNWEAVTETWNDFLYNQQSEAHYNLPFYDYAHWTQAGKLERMVKRPYNPMQKVFRTAGIIKGAHPMALVVDDIQKDNNVHQYQWLAQIARDLSIQSTDVNLSDNDYKCDIVLEEPSATGNRLMLVRILHNEGYNGSSAPGITDLVDYFDYFSGNAYNPNPNWDRPRLVVESNSVNPGFKVLLYPHIAGEALPVTNWNTGRDSLQILFPDEEKWLRFFPVNGGGTDFELFDNNPASLAVNLWLEGPGQVGATMTTDLWANNLIPANQPFNVAPYNYVGSEVYVDIGVPVVDWVLLELRSGADPSQVVERKAVMLREDGSLLDMNGAAQLSFASAAGSYYLAAFHRGHLGVVSAQAINLLPGASFDFTSSLGQTMGVEQQKLMANGKYALHAGDFDGNGVVNNLDFNIWFADPAGFSIYTPYDVDLNTVSNNLDFNLWNENRSKLGVSEIQF